MIMTSGCDIVAHAGDGGRRRKRGVDAADMIFYRPHRTKVHDDAEHGR